MEFKTVNIEGLEEVTKDTRSRGRRGQFADWLKNILDNLPPNKAVSMSELAGLSTSTFGHPKEQSYTRVNLVCDRQWFIEKFRKMSDRNGRTYLARRADDTGSAKDTAGDKVVQGGD